MFYKTQKNANVCTFFAKLYNNLSHQNDIFLLNLLANYALAKKSPLNYNINEKILSNFSISTHCY